MKKSFLFCTIITVILLTHNVAWGEDLTRVGLIDLQRCLQESKEGQRATQLLKKKKAVLQRQLNTKQKELLGLRRELEKQAMMLTMNAQEDRRRTVERRARELEYFLKDLNEDMRRVQEKERKRIFEELGKIIEEIGSKGDYALILEKGAGGVLYWAKPIDITDQVIRAYDQLKEEESKE